MRFLEFVFRIWYYFRIGYGTYLSFFVGFFTFVSTTYYLAVTRLPFLQGVFTHFYAFIVFAILMIIPLGVLIGWFHMKRTLAYPTEISIGVEANPYNYIAIPGKELEVYTPGWILMLTTLRRILEKEDMLSAEEKREFEEVVRKMEKLLKGEVVGKPRQRQLLAILEKKEN